MRHTYVFYLNTGYEHHVHQKLLGIFSTCYIHKVIENNLLNLWPKLCQMISELMKRFAAVICEHQGSFVIVFKLARLDLDQGILELMLDVEYPGFL